MFRKLKSEEIIINYKIKSFLISLTLKVKDDNLYMWVVFKILVPNFSKIAIFTSLSYRFKMDSRRIKIHYFAIYSQDTDA